MKFEESYSYLGACCSFNYHPNTLETAEFFKAETFGIDGGLNVIGTGGYTSENFISGIELSYRQFSRRSTPSK